MSIVDITTKIQGVLPQVVTERAQPEDEPSEGIDTSPNTLRLTWVLQMHQKHAADYVHQMVEVGISLPMGEDWLVLLITDVLHFFFLLLILMPFCISLLVLLWSTAIHLFITTSYLPSGSPENLSGKPYSQHSRTPTF